MKAINYLAFSILLIFYSCSSLTLKPADFSWPVESVQKVDNDGNVQVKRYSLSFNAKNLYLTETGDSLGYVDKELRIIRGVDGYYYVTGNNFKNVYVFNAKDGALKLENKIEISDKIGMQNPAFNQRPPYVELNYGNVKVDLNKDGITEEGK